MEELRGFLHGNKHWTKNGSEEHDNFLNLKTVYLKPGCFLCRSGQAGSANSWNKIIQFICLTISEY